MPESSPGDPHSLRIVVLQGGDSSEREISLQSGAAVAAALRERGHAVHTIDPSDVHLSSVDWPRFDAAFIALHGRFGEDGCVQKLLDGWGVPYTGSDAAASRMAFSKSAAKERFTACGVPTPPSVLVHVADSFRQFRAAADVVGYPIAVKPDASGSSLGVSIVEQPDQLPAAIAACFDHGPFGLFEKAVLGTEWTLAMIDDERLPLIRIQPQGLFYDFSAKYEDDDTGYCLDHDLPAAVLRGIEDAGAAACKAIGARGIVRVDLRVDENLRPWVLEVNTVPGFTDHSLVPKAAARRGWTLGALCERAIQSCLQEHSRRRTNTRNGNGRPDSQRLREAG